MRMGMDYKEANARARKLMDKHGLTDWRFSWENLRNPMYATRDNPGGFWGVCDLAAKTIRLDYRCGRKFRQTLLHEIAHAKVGRPGHGHDWLAAADEVGIAFAEYLMWHMANVNGDLDENGLMRNKG